MILTTAIKRNDDSGSLDDLFGYKADDVETVREVEAQDNISPVLGQYIDFIDSNKNYSELEVRDILAPNEINQFLQICKTFDHDRCTKDVSMGIFASKLIQNSYNYGYNHFTIDTSDCDKISFLGSHLEGEIANPIKIKINGSVGQGALGHSKNIDVIAKGNVDQEFACDSENIRGIIVGDSNSYFAYKTKNSKFIIKGNVGYDSFLLTNDVDVIVKGDVANSFGGDSENLIATIYGKVCQYFGTRSKNFCAKIYGDVGWKLGYESKNANIYVKGNVYSEIGKKSIHFSAVIDGELNSNLGYGANNSAIYAKTLVGEPLYVGDSRNVIAGSGKGKEEFREELLKKIEGAMKQ
jgi:formylmethanofuran dehydrogenase subunit C